MLCFETEQDLVEFVEDRRAAFDLDSWMDEVTADLTEAELRGYRLGLARGHALALDDLEDMIQGGAVLEYAAMED